MPHYYFHIRDDADVPDEEGTDLINLDAARKFAIEGVRDLMAGTMIQYGRITLDHSIDIENRSREVLATVMFGDGVKVEDNRTRA